MFSFRATLVSHRAGYSNPTRQEERKVWCCVRGIKGQNTWEGKKRRGEVEVHFAVAVLRA